MNAVPPHSLLPHLSRSLLPLLFSPPRAIPHDLRSGCQAAFYFSVSSAFFLSFLYASAHTALMPCMRTKLHPCRRAPRNTLDCATSPVSAPAPQGVKGPSHSASVEQTCSCALYHSALA